MWSRSISFPPPTTPPPWALSFTTDTPMLFLSFLDIPCVYLCHILWWGCHCGVTWFCSASLCFVKVRDRTLSSRLHCWFNLVNHLISFDSYYLGTWLNPSHFEIFSYDYMDIFNLGCFSFWFNILYLFCSTFCILYSTMWWASTTLTCMLCLGSERPNDLLNISKNV